MNRTLALAVALLAGCSMTHHAPSDAGPPEARDAGESWVSTGGHCNPLRHPVIWLEGPNDDCVAVFFTAERAWLRLEGFRRLDPVWVPERGDMSRVDGAGRFVGDSDDERVSAIGWRRESCDEVEAAARYEDPDLDGYTWADSATGYLDVAQFDWATPGDPYWVTLEIEAAFSAETGAPANATLGARYAFASTDSCEDGLDPAARARTEANVERRERDGP